MSSEALATISFVVTAGLRKNRVRPISQALAGEPVGIQETEDGTCLVRFADLDIGIINRRTRKFHRFGPKRPPRPKTPINQPETVNDRSGL